MHILVVCSGNVSRSAMGEGLLRAYLEDGGIGDVTVSSAGTAVWAGPYGREHAASRRAVAALATRGIDISGHRATRATAALLRASDLVLGMTLEHSRDVGALLPGAAARTFTMKEFGIAADRGLVDVDDPSMVVDALHRHRPDTAIVPLHQLEIVDPINAASAVFARVASEVDRACRRVVSVLWPHAAPPQETWVPATGGWQWDDDW